MIYVDVKWYKEVHLRRKLLQTKQPWILFFWEWVPRKKQKKTTKERLWILKGSRDTLGRPGGGGRDSRSPSGVTQQSRGQTCPAPSVPRFPYREKVETTTLSLPSHIKALWEMQNAWPLQIHHLTSTGAIKMGRVEGNHNSCFQGWEAVNIGHSPRNLCPEDAVIRSTRCPLQFCEEARLLENTNVGWISTELKPCDPSFWVVLALCSAPPIRAYKRKSPPLKITRDTKRGVKLTEHLLFQSSTLRS